MWEPPSVPARDRLPKEGLVLRLHGAAPGEHPPSAWGTPVLSTGTGRLPCCSGGALVPVPTPEGPQCRSRLYPCARTQIWERTRPGAATGVLPPSRKQRVRGSPGSGQRWASAPRVPRCHARLAFMSLHMWQ